MFSFRDFWRRHKRKIFVTAGILGSGYLLYRLYDAQKRRLADLERGLAKQRSNEELINAQMHAHFENIQRIADTTTLPHAIKFLRSCIEEELNLSHLTQRLKKGKGQPDALTASEKLELWERLKILSFTKMVLSLWTLTMISLYIRVQVNILGRHMYIDTARGLGSSHLLEDSDLIDRDDLQKFLATADFLSNNGFTALMSNLQAAAGEVLNRKRLKDFFDINVLRETTTGIVQIFMNTGNPSHWVDYLMPEDKTATPDGDENTSFPQFTKFDQLMLETRAVLMSGEFRNVVDISLKVVVDAVMEDMQTLMEEEASAVTAVGGTSGMPLAKLVPRVEKMGLLLFDEPSRSRLIQIIRNVPEVELFFTLLYANAGV